MTSIAEPWVATRRRAIGTFAHLLVTDARLLGEADTLLADELAALDLACSRFREDSELLRLAGVRTPVTVSPTLAGALAAALDIAQSTDGLVDPTLGRALMAVGYDRTFSRLPVDGPTAVRVPARRDRWREIVVEGCEVTVPPGVDLDLGATAKAWAADHIAGQIAALGTGVLVNLGGDIATAGAAPDGGWPIEIGDRPDGGTSIQTVTIESGGLATSSTTERTWLRGGLEMHHILDPSTGLPAPSEWACVTVAAPTCLEANGLTTAAVVLGTTAPAWLEARGHPACLLSRMGEVRRLNGWPEPAARP